MSTRNRWRLVGLVAALLVPSCALQVSYSESHYACAPPDTTCPDGFECAASGFCELRSAPIDDAGALADAPPGTPDARPGTPDARPGTPDARPAPDAHPGTPDASPPPPDAALPPDAMPAPTTVNLVATRDTQLYSPSPTLNFGDFLEIMCATDAATDSPILYGFSLTSIPAGRVVQSAVLHLTTSGNALSGGSIAIFKLLQDWTEGTLDGTAGVANYVQRTATLNWAVPGAAGGARASSASATFSPTVTNTTYDINLPVSLVQGWVNSPATNFGIVLVCSSNQDASFFTRASTPSSRQPRLTVTYVS